MADPKLISDERLAAIEDGLKRHDTYWLYRNTTIAIIARLRQAEAREMRYREALEEARRRLAKGRALWNGPCHETDHVIAAALTALETDNG